MPRSLQNRSDGSLLDSWGRKNRRLPDCRCLNCGVVFRPRDRESKYCSRPCAWTNNGKLSTERRKAEVWWKNNRGYIEGRVLINGVQVTVKQHRWILEKHLGRPILRTETVHHINGNKLDNRIENLQIMSHGEHTSMHSKGRPAKKGHKLNLTQEERNNRSRRITERHARNRAARAALSQAVPK
jgi:hypothetical protein